MKKCTFMSLLLLLPLLMMASVNNNSKRITMQSSLERSLDLNDASSAKLGTMSRTQQINLSTQSLSLLQKITSKSTLQNKVRRAAASDYTIDYNDCQVLSYPTLSLNGDLDQYVVTLVDHNTGNASVLYLYTTAGSNGQLPAGTYTFSKDPANNTLAPCVGYDDEGTKALVTSPTISYGGYASRVGSGSVTISYNASNDQEITCTVDLNDTYGDHYTGTCTHVMSEDDLYLFEPDKVTTPYALQNSELSYNFYPQGGDLFDKEAANALAVFTFYDKDLGVNMNVTIRQTLGSENVKIAAGTYTLAKSGANTALYSLGSYDKIGLSAAAVSKVGIFNLVSGTVTIDYDADDNLTISADVASYKGTQFTASGVFDVNEYNFRNESRTVITIDAKTDKINVYNEGDKLGNNTEYMVLDFVTKEDIIRLPFIVPAGSDDQVPVGTYAIDNTLTSGSAQSSTGTDITTSQPTGCIVAKGAAAGSVTGFYYIVSGNITVAEDAAHDGEYVYDMQGTTHYGSTVKLHGFTWQDPEKPFYAEPKTTSDFTTDFDEVSESFYESSDDESPDTHVFEFKWSDKPGTKLDLALRCAPHSGKAIPAGVYDCSKDVSAGGIAVSTGQKDQGGGWVFSTYSYAEFIEKIEGVNYSTFYFIKSGTVTVAYPTEGSTDHILYTLDLVSHYGSTFKMQCEVVNDPEDAYKNEPQEVTTIEAKDCTSMTEKNYGDAYDKSVDVHLVQLKKDDKILALEVYTAVEGLDKLPAGDYPVALPYTTNTVAKGQGFDGKYQVGSFVATGVDADGYAKAIYYVESGNLNIAYDANNKAIYTLNALSHYGSTITFTYSEDGTGLENSNINSALNVYTNNGVILVTVATDTIVEVYNALGQKLYSAPSENGQLEITGLASGQLYIVKSDSHLVKVVL